MYLQFGLILMMSLALAWLVRALLQLRREQVELRQRFEAMNRLTELQAQSISGLTAGAVGVDKRLHRVEDHTDKLGQRQTAVERESRRRAAERPYDRAIRMVKQGAGVRRLVEELELSETEANLIASMHGDAGTVESAEV